MKNKDAVIVSICFWKPKGREERKGNTESKGTKKRVEEK